MGELALLAIGAVAGGGVVGAEGGLVTVGVLDHHALARSHGGEEWGGRGGVGRGGVGGAQRGGVEVRSAWIFNARGQLGRFSRTQIVGLQQSAGN